MLTADVRILCVLPEPWRSYYLEVFNDMLAPATCVVPEDEPPRSGISYAFVLYPPAGYLGQFKNLKAVFPVGAGVEHVLADPEIPNVPIVRMVQPDMAQRMSEYIVQHALNHLRKLRILREAQARAEWRMLLCKPATECVVGIMGLGTLGQHAAARLAALGFQVRGWSRTPKSVSGVLSFSGNAELREFLLETDILVNLLPLTPQTRHLVDKRVLSSLPIGASLVNASRGAIVRQEDLLELLDTGHLSEATLDAFEVEPLPADHPFWSHPRITVTPHCASAALAKVVAERLRAVIEAVERGDAPSPVVDRALGY